MDNLELYLLFFNLFAIFLVWLRIESRLSRLEGRFDQFLQNQTNPRKEVNPHGQSSRSLSLD